MTPDQIDFILSLPLTARLLLFEAAPQGNGWAIFGDGTVTHRSRAHGRVLLRHINANKGAWLPANPLPVIAVAAQILAQRHGLTPSIELLGQDGAPDEPDWTCRLVVAANRKVEASGDAAGIGLAVLRAVMEQAKETV